MSSPSPSYTFSGHETFALRYPWLKKGYDAVLDDPDVFLRDDAITTLGVGKNMVRSIRHWCLAAGVLEEDPSSRTALRPSQLGRQLLSDGGLDPYLEDPATLWLIHWQIASNRSRATTWFWTLSHFHEPEFTREALASALFKWTQTLSGKQVAESSVKRDVEVFLRTYCPSRHAKGNTAEDTLDCPLIDLGLVIQPGGSSSFRFQRGSQLGLPENVLLFAVLRFWDAFAPTAETLAVPDLARQPGSPGRLFKVDESALAARLEGIERRTGGAISFADTAGMPQLYRRERIDANELLGEAYTAGGRR
ncbi:MAG TPA: DUF4007 family protein [Gemmataceae bacterium]|jgi:hypothetical protein|nr:DUF4007 family protein [Gemmataceae bacterium]